MRKKRIDIWLQPVNKFVRNDLAGGIVLFSAAVVAIIVANSPMAEQYHQLRKYPFSIAFAGHEISKSYIIG